MPVYHARRRGVKQWANKKAGVRGLGLYEVMCLFLHRLCGTLTVTLCVVTLPARSAAEYVMV